MKLISVPFYRMPSEEKAYRGDRLCVNDDIGLYLVADGVSEAYSPSHPLLMYPGGLTGG